MHRIGALKKNKLKKLLDKKHELIYQDLGAISLKGKDEKLDLLKIHMSVISYEESRKEIEQVFKFK